MRWLGMSWINRKGWRSTNVLGVVEIPDSPHKIPQFVFAVVGAEGSSSDSLVLRQSMFLDLFETSLPPDSIILLDAGYGNNPHCLTPYRRVRYHLQDFGKAADRPRDPKEFYNLTHAKIRNCVERAFGVLKNRWRVLKEPMKGDVNFCLLAISACILLHNLLAARRLPGEVEDWAQEAAEVANAAWADDDSESEEEIDDGCESQDEYRNNLAQACFREYVQVLRNRGVAL